VTSNPPENPPADPKPGRKAAPKVGDVLQTGKNTYAIVVGSEEVKHFHEGNQRDQDGEQTHPLVLDLPGNPRRHELAPYAPEK
jgi:hypothetical protein